LEIRSLLCYLTITSWGTVLDPSTYLETWYWFFVGPALLLAILSLRGERKRAAYVERRPQENAARVSTGVGDCAGEGPGPRATRESGGAGEAD